MNPDNNIPCGQLLLRTLAMPADTNANANGDIFGGWIMSQLDLAGAILAKEISGGRVVTVSVESIEFKAPVGVGDVVCCYGECKRIGNTSMSVALEVWVKPVAQEEVGERYRVCQATFNYVAINSEGRPRPIKKA
ncbi:putative acyl-CoA thioester hydrolase [Photobacterium damselae subsp. piscicida]|uniref:Acyl-CoA thioester hydrolase n=2 Tax=Photobacterium damselae TaxID=38293 RepID=A0A1V1VB13_PHODP|nr:acyl-CoA thioester hydrolase YciA [Photobacterium damselae]MBE8129567.1 acyl-CoA thioester hydrolase YciA [Photobacterium damselae subsp. piscicida]MDP2516375.1 acyl-CoA thioester hydrolase YciA [Photobacterium damselae subsp. piscicida]MDP2533023.1 acyl-CoA thioester hydrolase YciA [Photobacterium damselae subsp. piscicida]MDP2543938.1 acyl-CoA thioester hydrolase YciA [Photobacterium damselae subsp. piscicida]MDP2559085.1 acyl-CoA thioester hydrolase YciA [Photobacterium damselae subsp. p